MATEAIEAYSDFASEDDSDTEEGECEHIQTNNIDGSIICINCGLKVSETLVDNENRYYGALDTRYSKDPSRHNQYKNIERSLYIDLEALGFPQDIIERANVYYKDIIKNKIYRAKNRMSIVFACTYHAFEDVDATISLSDLALKFKLNKKGVSNGLKIFSHIFRKRQNKKYIDAMDLVPKILSDLNIDKEQVKTCINDIKLIYDFVQSKSKAFNSSNPQSIAAGIIYYYMKLNERNISRVEFAKIVRLTDITFTKIANDIGRVLDNRLS